MTDRPRSLALDVFRGMTICLMIVVNSPGSWDAVYAPLLHAPWHGFTPTDLVFPSFLFAVGNAMAFSMPDPRARPAHELWGKTLRRAAVIFVLGLWLNALPRLLDAVAGSGGAPWGELRILGVLQRIALCYLGAVIVLRLGSRRFALSFCLFALLAYWLLAQAFGDPADPYGLAGNAARRLDRWLLGDARLYQGEGIAFEPEGVLSTLPATVNVIAGYLAGDLLRRRGDSGGTLAPWMLASAALILTALLWDSVFPINKKLWTSSFVLLTVGIDLALLAALVHANAWAGRRRWAYFFVVFGRNPLLVYLLSQTISVVLALRPPGGRSAQRQLYEDLFCAVASSHNASLLFALALTLLCWAVGYALDRKRIYLKV